MEDLDKQLAQLQLMNSRDLSPKPIGLLKKVGPAVPPKPTKKMQSQVNSQRNDYSNMKMTLDNPAILEQKLEALEHHKKVLENQQKRRNQIGSHGNEKDAIYTAQQQQHPQQQKLGATEQQMKSDKLYENQKLMADNKTILLTDNSIPIYSNLQDRKKLPSGGVASTNDSSNLIYSNIIHNAVKDDGYRSTAGYTSNYGQEDLPPPPPLEIPPPLNLVDSDYHHHHHHSHHVNQISEDELPPPPSPVSSSYSELRRATDNTFSVMPSHGGGGAGGGYPESSASSSQTYQHLNNSAMGAAIGQPSGNNGSAAICSSGIGMQTRQNVPINGILGGQSYTNSYHTDFRTYVPSSQSFNSDYYSFGSSSQSSSTYESIYEPINPRPPSQMSSRSNYSLYTPYVSGSQTKLTCPKEAEVDALTDLLVRSMDNNDIDSYGICVQCGERVIDESSGCTAMEQIYHIACFTCCQCQINLQGKPFYALDGKPCCEDDYLNTLEKCSVCMKPILERILRATGKPYHPGCFCCVVCGKSLDGVPFTVDATNQNHCIEDFHKKFAPRCCVCRQPIMPEPGEEETVRVVALDRSFHVSCYKCEDCGLLLSSEAEGRGCFPLDDHILCKSCNAKRVQALTSHMTTEL